MLNRRSLLATVGAGLPAAALAQAQIPPPVPQVPATPPTIPPAQLPLVPNPLPGPPHPTAGPVPAPPPGPIDPSKSYIVFFDQVIDVPSIRGLRRQMNALLQAGVGHVTLVVSSPGGLVYQALAAYSLLRALPLTFDTHATGLVASAANILFLAGTHRTADRNARFFFHASQGTVLGSVTSQQLKDRMAQFAAVTDMEAAIYRDRTRLTEADIARFDQQEVYFTAPEALQAGIIDAVEDLHIPGDGQSRLLFLE